MSTRLASALVLASLGLLAAAALAAIASAQATYGGIGATISTFYAGNTQGAGTPPVGVAYYQIDDARRGRVAAYHVVLNPQSKLSTAALKRLVTARELPADAEQIKGWIRPRSWQQGYCAVYKSHWLGWALYGPYVVLHVSARDQTAGAWVSTAPFCRG